MWHIPAPLVQQKAKTCLTPHLYWLQRKRHVQNECSYVYTFVSPKVHKFICSYVRVFICAYVRMCVCAYVHMCECANVRMCVCANVRMCVCVYVRMCICAYVHMGTCSDVYMCRGSDMRIFIYIILRCLRILLLQRSQEHNYLQNQQKNPSFLWKNHSLSHAQLV